MSLKWIKLQHAANSPVKSWKHILQLVEHNLQGVVCSIVNILYLAKSPGIRRLPTPPSIGRTTGSESPYRGSIPTRDFPFWLLGDRVPQTLNQKRLMSRHNPVWYSLAIRCIYRNSMSLDVPDLQKLPNGMGVSQNSGYLIWGPPIFRIVISWGLHWVSHFIKTTTSGRKKKTSRHFLPAGAKDRQACYETRLSFQIATKIDYTFRTEP